MSNPTTAQATASPKPPSVSAVLTGTALDGGNILGVVGKRTYTVASGACRVAAEQIPLVEDPVFRAEEGALVHDTDLVLNREAVDIIVEGHAYSPGRAPFDIRIGIANFIRQIRVYGDRRLDRTSGRLVFTPCSQFDKIPLAWEGAYGGVDEVARRSIGDPIGEMLEEAGEPYDPRFGLYAYPRNPLGKGYLVEPTPDAIDACSLPNFEDPSSLLTPQNIVRGDFMLWPKGPSVAATGWLCPNYFPRAVQCGLPPRPYNDAEVRPDDFFEVRAGLVRPESVANQQSIQGRVDTRAAQQAAIGMRMDSIKPGAPVELVNLHARLSQLRFSLPRAVPRMAYKLPGASPTELTPAIRTVLLEPDHDRVTLVWVGQVRIQLPMMPRQIEEIKHGVIWSD